MSRGAVKHATSSAVPTRSQVSETAPVSATPKYPIGTHVTIMNSGHSLQKGTIVDVLPPSSERNVHPHWKYVVRAAAVESLWAVAFGGRTRANTMEVVSEERIVNAILPSTPDSK
ncbi:hypothetical protein FRB99_008298 [Tulasnella sp. 403]|nr:hypothetical protein FRB99_008298 [Tulasnella sp. 403]